MQKKMIKTFLLLALLTLTLKASEMEILGEINTIDSNFTDENSTIVDGTNMLWEVSGVHGGKVYLLGSIHVGKPNLYPLDTNITEAFKESNYLVLESKSDEDSQIAINNEMFKHGKFSSTQTLKDVISNKNYERLQIKLKSLKMLPGSLDVFRPWVGSFIISMTEIIKLGYSSEFGMDYYFERKAAQDQKPIFTIESVNDQLGIFADENDSFGEQLLELTLDTSPQSSNDIEMLFEKWKEGDIEYFEKELIAPMDQFPELKEKLLIERNNKMTQKVNVYRGNRKGRTYFVVVGLAHLLGDQGIVQQLKDQNLTVLRR